MRPALGLGPGVRRQPPDSKKLFSLIAPGEAYRVPVPFTVRIRLGRYTPPRRELNPVSMTRSEASEILKKGPSAQHANEGTMDKKLKHRLPQARRFQLQPFHPPVCCRRGQVQRVHQFAKILAKEMPRSHIKEVHCFQPPATACRTAPGTVVPGGVAW